MTATHPSRRNRRPKKRELFCPAHPDQRIQGNGKKYYLHLLQPEQLRQRGMSARKAQLIINAYPVLVLSDEWLEELFCPQCGSSRWCQVIKHDRIEHTVRIAPRRLTWCLAMDQVSNSRRWQTSITCPPKGRVTMHGKPCGQ